jgi:glycosyltransferase involved in cell wall biosynthesis
MKVGFLLFHPLSESLGSSRRVIDLAVGLKEKGVDPIIITPFSQRTKIRGIDIEEFPGFFPKLKMGNHFYKIARDLTNNGFLGRFLIRNMIRRKLGKSHFEVLQNLGLDILQMEQELTSLMAFPMVKKLAIPLVLEFHGIWADELVDSGIITSQSKEYQNIQAAVSEAVTQTDAVLVMGEEMKSYVVHEYGAKCEKVHITSMGVQPRITELPPRHGPAKVVYAGMFSKEKNVELFLKSIPHIFSKNENIKICITKKGNMVNDAIKVCEECGAAVELFWFDHEEQLFDYLSRCNIGILTLPNNLSYRLNPAAKFFDYLSVGLPVVSNDIGGWVSLIEEKRTGILTKDDPIDFSRGVLKLIENPTLAQTYSQNGLNLVREEYNANKTSKKLADLYSVLLSQRKAK